MADANKCVLCGRHAPEGQQYGGVCKNKFMSICDICPNEDTHICNTCTKRLATKSSSMAAGLRGSKDR